MKKKDFNKKLALNKKTIADLGNTEMNDVKGGADTDFPCIVETDILCTRDTRCPTCPQISCFIQC